MDIKKVQEYLIYSPFNKFRDSCKKMLNAIQKVYSQFNFLRTSSSSPQIRGNDHRVPRGPWENISSNTTNSRY